MYFWPNKIVYQPEADHNRQIVIFLTALEIVLKTFPLTNLCEILLGETRKPRLSHLRPTSHTATILWRYDWNWREPTRFIHEIQEIYSCPCCPSRRLRPQNIDFPLPCPLEVFEMLVVPEQTYPLICVAVSKGTELNQVVRFGTVNPNSTSSWFTEASEDRVPGSVVRGSRSVSVCGRECVVDRYSPLVVRRENAALTHEA